MADGNFNRTHLPNRPFLSGVKAGRAQMYTLAVSAFCAWMDEQGYDEKKKTEGEMRFRELLSPSHNKE